MPKKEMNETVKIVRILCVQDESQLKELFYEMVDEGGIESVENLFSVADEFLNEYMDEDYDEDIECHGISDEEDYRQVDDAQRSREASAINGGRF